jgi:hypothetical protein
MNPQWVGISFWFVLTKQTSHEAHSFVRTCHQEYNKMYFSVWCVFFEWLGQIRQSVCVCVCVLLISFAPVEPYDCIRSVSTKTSDELEIVTNLVVFKDYAKNDATKFSSAPYFRMSRGRIEGGESDCCLAVRIWNRSCGSRRLFDTVFFVMYTQLLRPSIT